MVARLVGKLSYAYWLEGGDRSHKSPTSIGCALVGIWSFISSLVAPFDLIKRGVRINNW